MSRKYFIQSVLSDKNYPMPFCKVRDNDTTYIVDSVEGIPMHQGIYIDIFPIDKTNDGILDKLLIKVMNTRISCIFKNKPCSFRHRIRRTISCLLLPSLRHTLLLREYFLSSGKNANYVCLTGGKSSEAKIPLAWFASFEQRHFEGVDVFIPVGYDSYLTQIYGEYSNRTLVEGKLDDNKVHLNAVVVDFERPYSCYMQK